MKKILVTGGTGYIGSHIAVELINRGYEIVIIDDLSNSKAEALKRIRMITWKMPAFYKFNLCDLELLERFFAVEKNIDAVLHFAASKAAGESKREPLKYYRNNVLPLINILECMKVNNIKNIIFPSSSSIYGQCEELPIREDSIRGKIESTYASTKIIGEKIISDFVERFNSQAVIFRFFNAIGAHESGMIGEYPLGEPENLVPYITQTAAGKRDCLKIFGRDYNTPDGTGVRDYLHVMDLADAHVRTLELMRDNKLKSAFEVYNLGTGKGVSVMEIMNAFEKANGIRVKHKVVDRRPGDIEAIFADSQKANDELGWQARRSLEDSLRDAWRWEKNLKAHGSF